MRLLLDTHALIWALSAPSRLAPIARNMIVNPDTDVFVSVASVWEIGIKFALGKIRLPGPPRAWLQDAIANAQFDTLSITNGHAYVAADLPLHHRDPFDRMLVAQALCENLTLVTVDESLKRYGVNHLTG